MYKNTYKSGANNIRIGGVVVVRIPVIVDISKISRRCDRTKPPVEAPEYRVTPKAIENIYNHFMSIVSFDSKNKFQL